MAEGEVRIKDITNTVSSLSNNFYFVVDDGGITDKTYKFSAEEYLTMGQYLMGTLNNEIDTTTAMWSASGSYVKGDVVINPTDARIYACNVANATVGTFVSSEWSALTLMGISGALFLNMSAEPMTFNQPISKGDVVYRVADASPYNPLYRGFYRAKADHPDGVASYVASDWDYFASLTALISDSNNRVITLEDEMKETVALGTASGSIASFTDGSTLPMKKLEVAIEPVQDLHGYENPWVGGSQTNKMPPLTTGTYTQSGYTATVTGDGKVRVTGNNSGSGNVTISIPLSASFNISSSQYVHIRNTQNNTNTVLTVGSVYTGMSPINKIWSYPNNETISSISIYIASVVGQVDFTVQISVENSDTVTTWQPYSNICPISGWDECNVGVVGKNLFDKTMTLENGYIDASGQVVILSQYKHTQLIKIKPNTSYVGSGYLSSGSGYLTTVAYYDKNQNFISQSTMGANAPYSMTTPQNANYLILSGNAPQVDTIQLEEGTTPTTYEPYNGHTYTIDLDGTRYGGKLDVVSGVLTVDRMKWILEPDASQIASVSINDCLISIPSDKTPIDWNVTINKCMCNKLKVSNYSAQHDNHVHFPNASILALYLADEVGTTKQDWVDYLAQEQIEVSYILATSQTIQLTPTEVKSLLATNNIFADTGDILDATYVRNANITINELIRRIENLEG